MVILFYTCSYLHGIPRSPPGHRRKLRHKSGALMASPEREPIMGYGGGAPSGVQGQSPWSGGHGAKPPEAESIWSFRSANWVQICQFLANVKSRSRSLFAIARPSVCLSVCLSVCRLSVCNARAPYSGGSNFRHYLSGIRYLGHPLEFTENFTEIFPGKPLRWGN